MGALLIYSSISFDNTGNFHIFRYYHLRPSNRRFRLCSLYMYIHCISTMHNSYNMQVHISLNRSLASILNYYTSPHPFTHTYNLFELVHVFGLPIAILRILCKDDRHIKQQNILISFNQSLSSISSSYTSHHPFTHTHIYH